MSSRSTFSNQARDRNYRTLLGRIHDHIALDAAPLVQPWPLQYFRIALGSVKNVSGCVSSVFVAQRMKNLIMHQHGLARIFESVLQRVETSQKGLITQ